MQNQKNLLFYSSPVSSKHHTAGFPKQILTKRNVYDTIKTNRDQRCNFTKSFKGELRSKLFFLEKCLGTKGFSEMFVFKKKAIKNVLLIVLRWSPLLASNKHRG